jgi:hypothetical protein
MNQLRDCSVLGDLAWFEGKPAVNEDWAGPFHPLIASGASRLCMLAPSGLRTLIGPAHGAYATLAQVPRYDPVPALSWHGPSCNMARYDVLSMNRACLVRQP